MNWVDGDLLDFVTNTSSDVSAPAFQVNAELMGASTSRIITTNQEQEDADPQHYVWYFHSTIRLFKVLDPNGYYIAVFVQLGSFDNQWVPGDVLRVSVTLLDNEQTCTFDTVIPPGTTTILNNQTSVVLPEYSLENPGLEDYYPVNIPVLNSPLLTHEGRTGHDIPNVPAYKWSFGCAPTACAMLLGYYDRYGYPNIYTSDDQSQSIAPLTTIWPAANMPNDTTERMNYLNPISASKLGLNGRLIRGHVDDYYDHALSKIDPYAPPAPVWAEHEKNDPIEGRCVADYLGTSQYVNKRNIDGASAIQIAKTGIRTEWNASTSENQHGSVIKGIHDYLVDCGYGFNIVNCYFQKRSGYTYYHNNPSNYLNAGFTWDEFKTAIDSNKPLLMQISTYSYVPVTQIAFRKKWKYHTVLAYGYETEGNDHYVKFINTDGQYYEMSWEGTCTLEGVNWTIIAFGVVDLGPVTGIEDGIHMTGNNEPSSNSTESYHVTFTDEAPYGNEITTWKWNLYVYHDSGRILLASNTLSANPPVQHTQQVDFDINFPSNLPQLYTWIRNTDGSIKAEIDYAGIESDGYENWGLMDMKLGYAPGKATISSVSQIDNEIHISCNYDGATTYNVYYGCANGGQYYGTGATQGSSPVTFSASSNIILTGLTSGLEWHIAVQAVNDYGNGQISDDYVYKLINTNSLLDEVTLWDHNLTLTHPIVISETGNLHISNGSIISLIDNANITCQLSGMLQFDNNTIVKGNKCTQYIGESNPQIIPGNYIQVYGSITIGNNVKFESYDGTTWDGLIINNSGITSINNCSFKNCSLQQVNGSMYIANTIFDNVYIQGCSSGISLLNCQGNMGLYCTGSPLVTVENTHFTGQGHAIELNDCHCFIIEDCEIHNMTGNGIVVTECNDTNFENNIIHCTIQDNTGDGIRFYHSLGKVVGCVISGNSKGIVAFRGSNVEVFTDPLDDPWVYGSIISNNIYQEIMYMNDCNLRMDGGENRIVDNGFDENTFDQYLVVCPNLTSEYDPNFRHNYWGYQNGPNNALIPPANRFFPSRLNPATGETGYFIDPVWNPGFPHIIDKGNDEIVYDGAIDLAVAGNASDAIALFKELISQYPYSLYAKASEVNIAALEEDKLALINYLQTEPNLHWNGEIDKITDYLVNWCNIKLGNYDEAILWFETIIDKSPSEYDSLMAVIDLGYTYLLMEENGIKDVPQCRYPQFMPQTRKQYERIRDNILTSLYIRENDGIVENQGEQSAVNANPVLYKNYPNPFNPSTTISYSLPEDMKCELQIFNIRGQLVKTLVNNVQTKGENKVIWDGTNNHHQSVASGVYFYRLDAKGKRITNKMLLLK